MRVRPKNVFEIIEAALVDLLMASGIALSPNEVWTLVARVKIVHRQIGERLFQQGEEGYTAYILADGRLRGRVDFKDLTPPKQFELVPGALIGEISLMSGIHRTATVWAETPVKLLELSPMAFSHLLSLRPEIPEILSGVVARRQVSDREYLRHLKSLRYADIQRTQNPNNILQHFRELPIREFAGGEGPRMPVSDPLNVG